MAVVESADSPSGVLLIIGEADVLSIGWQAAVTARAARRAKAVEVFVMSNPGHVLPVIGPRGINQP